MTKGRTWEPGSWELVGRAFMPESCDALIRAAAGRPRIVMPHRFIGAFAVAMTIAAKFARDKIGPEVSGLGSDYFSVSAGFKTHADNDHVQALPGTFMSVWIALDDVTLKNGPLVIDGAPVCCAKGDAILLDGDNLHRSCAGHGPRPVALFTYIQTGQPFRPGTQQMREEVPL